VAIRTTEKVKLGSEVGGSSRSQSQEGLFAEGTLNHGPERGLILYSISHWRVRDFMCTWMHQGQLGHDGMMGVPNECENSRALVTHERYYFCK
jgi:hypothetical protein